MLDDYYEDVRQYRNAETVAEYPLEFGWKLPPEMEEESWNKLKMDTLLRKGMLTPAQRTQWLEERDPDTVDRRVRWHF